MKEKGAEIVVFLFGGLFILFGIIIFSNSKVKLGDLNKYTGIVINKGITIKPSTSRYGRDSKVFYIDLNGLNERLAIYKWNKDYTNLINSIHVYDTLTVYYSPIQDKSKINIDLYQIETNENVLYDLKDSTPRFIFSGIVVILFSLPLIGFGFFLRRLRINGSITLKRKKKK